MSLRLALALGALTLTACSSEPAADQDGADDFASRIGQTSDQEGSVADDPQSAADRPNTASVTVPAGADVTKLQQLGDVGGVDFGPRGGSCTFMEGNREMLMAAGMAEPTMPGKAVIRIGDTLTMLDGQPGGLAGVRRGGAYTGDGVSVQIAPAQGDAANRPANLSVTSADGKSAAYSGNWICS